MFSHAIDQVLTEKIKAICAEKKLNFNEMLADTSTSKDSSIEEHAAWAYRHIYSVAFSDQRYDSSRNQGIARPGHGIHHTARAAIIYAPITVNIYRKYKDKNALTFTPFLLLILQIAILFHDAGRNNDGVDKRVWEEESAYLVYFYLLKIGIDPSFAKLLAEAIVNKDTSQYYALFHNNGELGWKLMKIADKNMFLNFMQCTDCFDYLRTGNEYLSCHLNFVKQIAIKNSNATEHVSHLIREMRSYIEKQGDNCQYLNFELKKYFENEKVGERLMAALANSDLQTMKGLFADGKLLSEKELSKDFFIKHTYHEGQGITEKNLRAAFHQHIVYLRGVPTPAAFRKKPTVQGQFGYYETLGALELRKAMRRLGVPTQSKKSNADQKEHNPNRSTAMGGVFTDAGFLIIDNDPEFSAVKNISKFDFGSGRGKEKEIGKTLTTKEKKEKFAKLFAQLDKGEVGCYFSALNFTARYAEIIRCIKGFDAIYYSPDPSIFNMDMYGNPNPPHPHYPLIEAIYLYFEYLKKHQKKLPIFKYSYIHDEVKQLPDDQLTDENIIQLWVELCGDYIDKELQKIDGEDVYHMSIAHLKINSMYQGARNKYAKCNGSPDSNYDSQLRHKINEAILHVRQKNILRHEECVANDIIVKKQSILEDSHFHFIYNSQSLQQQLRETIIQQVKKICSTDAFIPQSFPAEKSLFEGIDWSFHQKILREDKEEMFRKNNFAKKIYYQKPMVKLFFFLKIYDMQEELGIFMQQAKKLFHEALEKFEQEFTPENVGFAGYSINIILDYAYIFDFLEEENSAVKVKINKISAMFLNNQQYDLLSYRAFIDLCKISGFYTEEVAHDAKKLLQAYEGRMEKNKYDLTHNELSQYLLLVEVMEIPFAIYKKHILNWLKQTKINFSTVHENFFDSLHLFIHDKEILTMIINKVARTSPQLVFLGGINLFEMGKNLELLRLLQPAKLFDAEIEGLIKEKFKIATKDLCAKICVELQEGRTTPEIVFEQVEQQLKHYNKLGMPSLPHVALKKLFFLLNEMNRCYLIDDKSEQIKLLAQKFRFDITTLQCEKSRVNHDATFQKKQAALGNAVLSNSMTR